MFGASHLIRGVSDFSLPEDDPNEASPPADRVFRSPAEKTPVSAILWFELGDGTSTVTVEVWVRADRSWRRAGSTSVNEPGISADVSLPSDADLFVRVLAGAASKDALLATGFRPAPSLNATSLVAGGLLVTSTPLFGDPGFPAYLINPVVVSSLGGVSSVNQGLEPTDDGLPVRTIEEAGRVPVILGLGGEGGDQPIGTVLAPLFVRGSDGTDAQQLALDRTRSDEAAAVKLALADGSDFYDAARAAQLPPAIGQQTSSDSLSVVLASDGTLPLPTGAATETTLADIRDVSGVKQIADPVDISDRGARLIGVVYGSQGQQIRQTAVDFNLQAELAVGGSLIDPRQTRALTAADVVSVANFPATQPVSGTVTADQGSAAALSGAWPVKVTDGASVLGTGASPLRVDPTGSTAQPVTDAAGSLTVDAPVGTPVAVRQSNGSTFISPALDHTGAADFNSARLTDGSAFYRAAVAGDNMGADLRVASAAVTQTNPAFVRLSNGTSPIGVQAVPLVADPSTPTRTATGTPSPATSGTILAGAGVVWSVVASFAGAGAGRYLQIHEAGTLATTTMIPGLSFPLDILNQQVVVSFDRPLSISSGCKWAMSDSQNTYAASAQTAVVFFQAQ